MSNNHPEKRILREAGISFSGMSIGSVFRYSFSIILGRFFGAQLLGFYSIANAIMRISEVFALLGLDTGVLRFVSRNPKNKSDIKKILESSLKTAFLSSALIALGIFVLSDWLVQDILKEDISVSILLKWFSITLPFTVTTLILSSFTQAFQSLKYKIFVNQLLAPFTLLIFTILIFFISNPLAAIIFPTIISSFISIIAIFFFARRFSKISIKKIFKTSFNKEILQFSIPLMFVSAVGIIMHWTDILMLSTFEDAYSVGLYHPIERTAGLIRMIFFAFAGIFSPMFSKYYYEKNNLKMKEIFDLSSNWILTFSMPLFIFFVLFPSDVLSIFGDEFVNDFSLIFLLIGILIQSYFGLGASILSMAGFSNLNFLNVSIGLFLNIFFNWILIPKYGLDGAVIATSISLIILSIIRLVQIYSKFRILNISVNSLKPMFVGAVTFLIIDFIPLFNQSLKDSNFVKHVGKISLAFIFTSLVYFMIYRLIGISKGERMIFKRLKDRVNE